MSVVAGKQQLFSLLQWSQKKRCDSRVSEAVDHKKVFWEDNTEPQEENIARSQTADKVKK